MAEEEGEASFVIKVILVEVGKALALPLTEGRAEGEVDCVEKNFEQAENGLLLPADPEGNCDFVDVDDEIGLIEKMDGDAVALPVVDLEREGVWVKGMGNVGKGDPVSVGLEVAVAFSPVGRICPVHPTTKAKRRSERVIKKGRK